MLVAASSPDSLIPLQSMHRMRITANEASLPFALSIHAATVRPSLRWHLAPFGCSGMSAGDLVLEASPTAREGLLRRSVNAINVYRGALLDTLLRLRVRCRTYRLRAFSGRLTG